MSTSPNDAVELLFVRHGDARKRSGVSQVRKLLKRPFDDFGTTSLDSSDQSTFVLPAPPPELRSLLVGRFPKQEWFSVFSDSASIDAIVAANNTVGRLQFARLKRDLVGKLVVLEVLSGGTLLGRCEAGAGSPEFTVTGTKDVRASVADCADANSAMKAVRAFFQLDTALKTVVELDKCYSVIDEKARELNPIVCALLILEGRKSPKKGSVKAPTPIAAANILGGKPKRKVNLAAALTRLDAEEVRLAIKQGASLKNLTGFKVPPLHYVMQRFESPGARECAQALIEGGADIGNLVAECCTNIYGPQQSFDRVQFLIEHGGDVNAPLKAGVTAIFGACRQRNVAVVRLLMQHEADPDVSIPRFNATPVEWVEDMLRQETAPDRQRIYAEILTELRGVEVAVPQAEPLSDSLIAENERFVAALQAQELLANLPAEFRLQDAAEHKLQDNPKFTRLHSELLAEGFQQNGLRFEAGVLPVFVVTYTDEKRSMDAVVADRWWSKEVACRIMSHGNDGRLYSVGNVSNPVDPNFDPAFLIRGEHLRSRPRKLVLELAKLVKQCKATLLPPPPHEFASRYQSGNDRILAETKRLLNEKLSRDAICDENGRPLRFERRQNYLTFAGFSDPEFSSRHLAELTLGDIENTRAKDESYFLTSIVRDCFTLLAMQHLQYAGVPTIAPSYRKGAMPVSNCFRNSDRHGRKSRR